MFAYYFKLGLRNLRRNPVLTALMVLTLAVGVAASVSTLTILHIMSADPLPQKSGRVFAPLIDPGTLSDWTPGEEPQDIQVTYTDAQNLLKSGQGVRRTALYGIRGAIEPPRADLQPFTASGEAPTRDFFAMFDVPFLHGQAWTEQDDVRGADVVVLSRETAEKMYGSANPVGQRLNVLGSPFTVVGVIDTWMPLPRFYRLSGRGQIGTAEDFFIPLASAIRHEADRYGDLRCNGSGGGSGFAGLLTSECTWMSAWIETAAAGDRADLQGWLDSYGAEQRKLGRLKRGVQRLYDVPEWLQYNKVVGKDDKLSAWLAFGFLMLCLVNTVGLLLAKFSVRAAEIGVRRALGASRTEIFRQFLIETGVVGLVGGVLGLVLAFGALALIAMQGTQTAAVAHMDWQMLALTFVMSVGAALLAGLLPTWRACQVTPAIQLKSQ